MEATLYFSLDEYRERVRRVAVRMSSAGLDALLVTTPENICYLSGYQTAGYHIFQCMIVFPDGTAQFVVRNTEVVNIPPHSWLLPTEKIQVAELAEPTIPLLRAIASRGLDGARVGFEDRGVFLPPRVYLDLVSAAPTTTFLGASGLVEAERVVKSPAEVELIRRSTGIAEDAILAGVEATKTARTDSDVAAAVYARLAERGSEYTGSPPYVVAAHASLLTHASHGLRPIAENEHVWLEVSASQGRYHGVASRITGRGKPSAEVAHLFELSVAALSEMIRVGKPGMTSGELDAVGRDIVESTVPASYWPNRSGYGMGISFPPGLGEGGVMDLRPGDDRVLRAGMVFHLIPIMKGPDVGAVGCTETVVITEKGCESLVTLDRTPFYV